VETEIFSEIFDDLTKDIGHISDGDGSESQGLQLHGDIKTIDSKLMKSGL